MNILIIDDQPVVIEGVLAGVDWDNLPIEEKYTANNIFQAEDVIKNKSVQIMLCDIEMPMGSGLELYEWVQKNDYAIKCIFLTSHSDFTYAQQAIHLQGFDYLLQPVSYKMIGESIKKASDAIKMESLVDDYYKYGKNVKRKERDIQKSILREYLLGLRSDPDDVNESLAILSLQIKKQDDYNLVLISVVKETDSEWDTALLQYAIENIANEMFTDRDKKMIFIQINAEEMVCIYPSEQDDEKNIDDHLMNLYTVLESLLPIRVSLYYKIDVLFTDFSKALKNLIRQNDDNVTGKNGILSEYGKQCRGCGYVRPDLDRWARFIQDGYYSLLKKEAFEYMDKQEHNNNMNIDFLKKFHQDYLCLFFNALRDAGGYSEETTENSDEERVDDEEESVGDPNQVTDYNYEAMMNSYTSVERMKSLIEFSTGYLEKFKNNEDLSESRMQEIMKYIHNNIQKNITRRDVAEAVYLNPEYLSRLFRKEKKITMSDYILQEKMEIAKHLLETTKFPVSIVASKVGYTNFSHFAQCFKKIYGISPSDICREKS